MAVRADVPAGSDRSPLPSSRCTTAVLGQHSDMKLSVSLSDEDVLDAYVERAGLPSRSAGR